jgi:hypothetical protein
MTSANLCFCFFQQIEGAARIVNQRMARNGQSHDTCGTLEEPYAQLRLDPFQGRTRAGRGHVQCLRGACQRTSPRSMHDSSEIIDIFSFHLKVMCLVCDYQLLHWLLV